MIQTNQYGPWAVVTGASSGIGREFALELASSKLSLVVVGRNESALNELARTLSQLGSPQVKVIIADFAQDGAVASLIQATESLEVGLFVASAGFGSSGDFLDNDVASESEMVRVNCEAHVALTHFYGHGMRTRRRGGIVLLSSLVAWQGVPTATTYAATKAFVQSFGEGLYHELKPHGVHVICSAPGPVASGFGNRAGMNLQRAITPDVVGKETLKYLGRRSTVVPGGLSKFLHGSLITAPRALRVRIMKQVFAGFLK